MGELHCNPRYSLNNCNSLRSIPQTMPATTIQIFCKNTETYIEVPGGSTLSEIAESLGCLLPFKPICAMVNNRVEALSFPLFYPKQIEFMSAATEAGRGVYVRSLCMMLYKAVRDIYPDAILKIEMSVSRGYFCRIYDKDGKTMPLDDACIHRIRERMFEIAELDIPFLRKEKLTADVIEMFREEGLHDKVALLKSINSLYTTFYRLGDVSDSYYGPLAPSTSHIRVFDLISYKEGMLLLGFDPQSPAAPLKPVVQDKMYEAFRNHLLFNKIIKVADVAELNRAVDMRQTAELINVAEAMHDKLLGRISDSILKRKEAGGASIILLAGPSSSGKTTTCKRLAIQLMTNLIVPKMISLDDYFVNREDTPKDETGDYDYESLYALDLKQFRKDLIDLLAGKEINLPTYSFELGRRIDKERPLRLDEHDVLLIEGIHGLNPELTADIPAEQLFKIYVSPLTTLCIDNHNWVSATDNRLLRRIVRDHKYRNTSAAESIRRWPSVRRGEMKWIYPFAEEADATFNSSLIFELGVMKDYAVPLLEAVPHNSAQYAEAYRLLKFLSYFRPIPADQVPTTSLLREFLGGSSFHY